MGECPMRQKGAPPDVRPNCDNSSMDVVSQGKPGSQQREWWYENYLVRYEEVRVTE